MLAITPFLLLSCLVRDVTQIGIDVGLIERMSCCCYCDSCCWQNSNCCRSQFNCFLCALLYCYCSRSFSLVCYHGGSTSKLNVVAEYDSALFARFITLLSGCRTRFSAVMS